MNEPIKIPCDFNRGQLPGVDYIATIADDHIRAIVGRANALGLFERKEGGFTTGVCGGIEYHFSTTRLEPAAPADDEATIAEMRRIFYESGQHMGDLLVAITQGEIPGLTTIDSEAERARFERWHAQGIAERDALKSEVERLREEVQVMCESREMHRQERDADRRKPNLPNSVNRSVRTAMWLRKFAEGCLMSKRARKHLLEMADRESSGPGAV